MLSSGARNREPYRAAGLIATLGAVIVLSQGSPVLAQNAPGPAPQVTPFGAWETHCMPAAAVSAGVASCRVVSSITVPVAEGQRAVAAVVMVAGAPERGDVRMAVQLPISVWLPTGVRIEGPDGTLVAQFPFLICAPALCEAGGPLTAEQWTRVKASTASLSLRYELQGQQAAKLDFSMDGFVAAATSVGLAPA